MKVTVCELNDYPAAFEQEWAGLVAHVQAARSDLVLLPEMPFYPWFPRTRPFQAQVWEAARTAHQAGLARLPGLAPAAVLGTRPVEQGKLRLNEGFCWEAVNGYRAAHAKRYLPDEDGFWEATWYGRGPDDFTPFQAAGAACGFLICTELWFLERARAYGRQGVEILANPRGTLYATREKWLLGGRVAAVVSGAFCLSSNRCGPPGAAPVYGGLGWVIDPDGEVLGLTSPQQPFLTIEIDLQAARRAKGTYPRYVPE